MPMPFWPKPYSAICSPEDRFSAEHEAWLLKPHRLTRESEPAADNWRSESPAQHSHFAREAREYFARLGA